jgi:hypothetical protein
MSSMTAVKWLLPLCLVTACATDADDDFVSTDVTDASSDDAKADGPELAFTVVDDLPLRASVGKTEEGRVIRSATAFRTAFGASPPATLDFDAEWLAVYSAGVKTSGGYDATITKIRLSDSGMTVKVTSNLTEPGADCFVTDALTKPVAVVKFAAQPGASRSRFTKLTETVSCSTAGLCDADFKPVVETAAAGMTYMSESDYPLTYVTYGMQGAPTADKIRALTSTPAGTLVEEISFAELFDSLGEAYDPNDPYIVEYAAKYRALRAVLEENLTDLTVVRVGEVSIDVYIVGQTSCGELVGLKTTSIET